MLENLRIKNVALIRELEVNFDMGLNILSGETGAGKSMIIDSIIFLLGERPGRDFIRNGEDSASVEGLLYIRDAKNVEAIRKLGIDIDDDNMLLASRTLSSSGKSVCRLNGKTVNVGMLKEISSLLLDIHGQHEHQSLLNPVRHITLLDKYCGAELDTSKAALSGKVKDYRDILKSIRSITGNEKDRDAKIEILSFQKNEISAARLRLGEEEELTERREVLGASEALVRNTGEALELLYGGESGEPAVVGSVSKALALATEAARLDGTVQGIADTLEEINALLDDAVRELRRYWDHLESDPGELDRLEGRLDMIYRLKKKYGGSIQDILNHYEKITKELDAINNSEAELDELNDAKKKTGAEILSLCIEISNMRKKAAATIITQIEDVLRDLGMKNVRFDIQIEKKNEFSADGYDKVEFLISPNAGEPLKPLSKIASGGEMSRVMLALKTVLADADQIETFIFDEIDTGVSGRTAQRVAEKLSLLGGKHQLLCITHLPQIASMGDAHFLIEKHTRDEKTTTGITALDYDASVRELARLIGGAKITDATLKAAREMKEMALELKKN